MASSGPYAGVDPGIARRMGGSIWLVGALLTLPVIPLTPPTAAIGAAGWLVATLNCLIAVVGGVSLLRSKRVSFDLMLIGSYVALVQIGLAQWLAGGLEAPYWELYLLPALYVSAIHPPRRIVAFLVALIVAAAAPLAYEGWERELAAALVLGALLCVGSSLITFRLMREVRKQRTDSLRQEDHARRQARVDPLTGVGNRRGFDEAVGDQIAQAHATGESLSVVLADIDCFKRINDEHGHVAGDQCLRQVALAIQASLRATDACFRWGGDEFAVLLPSANAELASELCTRLQEAVAASCRGPDGEPLSVSCGHTELLEGMSVDDFVEAADLAMLTLKRSLAR
jgi:diguanylate cyclase (GGDEF)-like protein